MARRRREEAVALAPRRGGPRATSGAKLLTVTFHAAIVTRDVAGNVCFLELVE